MFITANQIKNKSHKRNAPAQRHKAFAFSLVEMLMALLVASLLMAALAPVMTKRMNEAKINISGVGAAQYDKDAIIQIFTKDTEEKVFNVPNDVYAVKVTAIGGGGAGGNSFYGKQEVTNTKEWTVPEGVTKLRVFMTGGGGGGASGGLRSGTAYTDIPSTNISTDITLTTPGEHKLSEQSISFTRTAPALNQDCQLSGITQWTVVSNNSKVSPGGNIFSNQKIGDNTNVVLTKVTACGGGGGGGRYTYGYNAGAGGSGGYMANKVLSTSASASNIYIKVGGGGGYGGGGGSSTTNGCNASNCSKGSNGGYSAGGGGYGYGYGHGSGGTYGGSGGTSSSSAGSQEQVPVWQMVEIQEVVPAAEAAFGAAVAEEAHQVVAEAVAEVRLRFPPEIQARQAQ